MLTTKLSSKGQVIIPQPIRSAHKWSTGTSFTVIETEEGILLKPQREFTTTTLEEVAGCLNYQGKKKTLEDMEDAIRKGIEETFT